MRIIGVILGLVVTVVFYTVSFSYEYGKPEVVKSAVPATATTSAKESIDIISSPGKYVLADLNYMFAYTEKTGADTFYHSGFLNDEYIQKQWALNSLQILNFPQLSDDVPEVIVAILDTGIDQNHEDLNGKVLNSINLTNSATVSDINGHGTHIAGIIAANTNNKTGIAGVAPDCLLLNVKVADDQGFVYPHTVAKGIIWAVDNGANVINISLALHQSSTDLSRAIDYAWDKGVIVVAAAGNEVPGTIIYPACYENVIAVTAVGESGRFAPLSNFANWVDAAAPGVNIYSCLPNNGYGYKSGTSFATGYVSGIAALLYTAVTDVNNNGYLNDEIRMSLEKICQLPDSY